MSNFEQRARYICERQGGAFEQIDSMIEQIGGPKPRLAIALENIVLEPTFDGGTSYDELTEDIRKNAYFINRVAIRAIYTRYVVDPTRTIARSHIDLPQTTELEPLVFMGVRVMGYRGGDRVTTDVQHFTDQGVGFHEQHEYSKRSNPGIEVRRTDNPFEPFDVAIGHIRVLPNKSRLSIYELDNGQFSGGEFSY